MVLPLPSSSSTSIHVVLSSLVFVLSLPLSCLCQLSCLCRCLIFFVFVLCGRFITTFFQPSARATRPSTKTRRKRRQCPVRFCSWWRLPLAGVESKACEESMTALSKLDLLCPVGNCGTTACVDYLSSIDDDALAEIEAGLATCTNGEWGGGEYDGDLRSMFVYRTDGCGLALLCILVFASCQSCFEFGEGIIIDGRQIVRACCRAAAFRGVRRLARCTAVCQKIGPGV